MAPDDRSGRGSDRLSRLADRMAAQRMRHPALDHLVRAVVRYRRDRVEYFSLRVVSRGLFLTVSMAMVWLYVIDATTSLIPGINEITIPTMLLSDERDLGAVVHATFLGSRAALLDVVGVATLVVSAALTAHALRQGTFEVLAAGRPARIRPWQPRNLAVGFGVAAVMLVSWLLVFATAIRGVAIRTLLGPGLTDTAIWVGKAGLILLAWCLVTAAVVVPLRRSTVHRGGGVVLAAGAAFGAFVVAADFVLLYTYVAALYGTGSAGGIVLVLTMLAWVNAVARGLFLTQCWIAEAS